MEDKSYEYYHSALITEFTAIREASLSRDQMKQTLENFMVIILSAVFVAYPTIVEKELFTIFPIVSIIITALAFSRRQQSVLATRLVEYEKVLQQNMISMIQASSKKSEKLPPNLNQIWNWQSYLHLRAFEKKRFKRLFVGMIHSGLTIIISMVSLGFPILFFFNKRISEWSPIEHLLLWTALIYSLILMSIFFKDKFFSR
jgi:hypothetical protein